MIHWLIQSVDTHPDLLRGLPPKGLLSKAERTYFDTLSTAKRRSDWLLGRWTAKHLLGSVMTDIRTFDSLSILHAEDGAPYVNGLKDVSLSISHSGRRAFCALVHSAEKAIGADIEHIEQRSPSFVSDYFTAQEITALNASADDMRDTLSTAIWSAKEAALKALHLGLRADTWALTCLLSPIENLPATWQPFSIQFHADYWREDAPPKLKGWWRVHENHVLSLVTVDDEDLG